MKNTLYYLLSSFLIVFLSGCKDDAGVTKYMDKVNNFDFEMNYDGSLHQFNVVDETQTLKIMFTDCMDLDVNVDVDITQPLDGISIDESDHDVFISSDEFVYELPVVGTPIGFGEFKIKVTVSGVGAEPIIKDYTFVVEEKILEPVDPIVITGMKLSGPIIKDNLSDSYKLEIAYTGGTDGTLLNLSSVTGYLVPDEAKMQTVSTKVSEGNGTITFDIGTDFFVSSNYNSEDDLTEGIDREIAVAFKYNGEDLVTNAELSTLKFKSCGFVSNGCSYNEVKVGDQIWLDRNLGATTNHVPTPTVDDEGNLTDWIPDFGAYGHYYQRGRATGIVLQSAETNPTAELAGQPWFLYQKNAEWSKGYWAAFDSDLADYSSYWLDATGNINNPCPSGFRVPTQEEIRMMINSLCTVDAFASDNVTKDFRATLLQCPLQFPLAGCISGSGPSSSGPAKNRGQDGMVGLAGKPSNQSFAPIVNGIDGQICLLSCDNASGKFVGFCEVAKDNISLANIHQNVAMPVRAIKSK